MSFLENLAGGLFGDFLGNTMNSAFDINSYEKKAEIDYNYTKKLWDYQMQNKHQLEVGDLEAAGLNKILSATNGQAISATPISGSSSNNQSDLGTTAVQLSIDQKKAEIADKEADIALKNSELERRRIENEEFKARTDRMRGIFQNRVDAANIGYLKGLTGKAMAETMKVVQDRINSVKELQGRLAYLKSGEALNYEQARQAGAMIAKLEAEEGLIKSDKYNLDLRSAQITKDLSDPKKSAERDYYSTWIGRLVYQWNLFINDLNPLSNTGYGVSTPVGSSGIRVGVHG